MFRGDTNYKAGIFLLFFLTFPAFSQANFFEEYNEALIQISEDRHGLALVKLEALEKKFPKQKNLVLLKKAEVLLALKNSEEAWDALYKIDLKARDESFAYMRLRVADHLLLKKENTLRPHKLILAGLNDSVRLLLEDPNALNEETLNYIQKILIRHPDADLEDFYCQQLKKFSFKSGICK